MAVDNFDQPRTIRVHRCQDTCIATLCSYYGHRRLRPTADTNTGSDGSYYGHRRGLHLIFLGTSPTTPCLAATTAYRRFRMTVNANTGSYGYANVKKSITATPHTAVTIVIDTPNDYECQYGFIQTRRLQETLWAPVSDILFLTLSHFGSNP